MVALSYIPDYPVPGRACSLVFATAGNHAKVWMSSAPAGSSFRAKIDASSEGRIPFYDGPSGEGYPVSLTPDKGGVYGFLISDVAKGATPYGGSYDGDPASDLSESPLSPASTVVLQVGERLEQPVGRAPDSAVLSWWVWGDYVRATTVEVQGEVTPSLTRPASSRAQVACESTDVLAAARALAGLTVSDAVGDLAAVLSDMVAQMNSHMATASPVHSEADAANPIPPGLAATVSPKDVPKAATRILAALKAHYTNDDSGRTAGVPPGPDSAAYHDVGGGTVDDAANLPSYDSAASVGEAFSAMGDAWRSYEAHRASTVVHGSPDSTNALAALPPLLALHALFMTAVSLASPAVPPTMNSGAVLAVSRAGFKKT